MKNPAIYGLLAEFEDPTSLVSAAERTHHAGFRCVDAYSPYPIEELHEALGSHHTRLPMIVLIGGVVGCLRGHALPKWGVGVAGSIHNCGQAVSRPAAVVP